MIHSFLLTGQSNMAGRGLIHEVAPIENEHLHVLRNGRWQKMYAPVNGDRPFSGICLAESFAEAYFQKTGVDVGLIPAADGNTSLNDWAEGGLLFDHAVFQAKIAARTSELKGILWHQGEADCAEALYPVYQQKLYAIIQAMRNALGQAQLPFLMGGLGDFLKDCPLSQSLRNYGFINQSLKALSETVDGTAFVSAEGLTSNPDLLHFNASSLREFGIRYFDAFMALSKA